LGTPEAQIVTGTGLWTKTKAAGVSVLAAVCVIIVVIVAIGLFALSFPFLAVVGFFRWSLDEADRRADHWSA
jgi:Flp pilus assembly protein TadB